MDLLTYDSASSTSTPGEDGIHRAPVVTKKRRRSGDRSSTGVGIPHSSSEHSHTNDRGSVSVIPAEQAPDALFQRTIPHKRGHWAGHVLVPVSSRMGASASVVDRHIQEFRSLLERNGFSGVIVQHSQLHLSLSKYFSLQLGCIDSFVDKLTLRLATERATRLFVNRRGSILVNEEKTRSFWCWTVQPNASLLRILQHVDAMLKDYGKPLYYNPPTFHISLASFAGNLDSLHTEQDDANAICDENESNDDDDDDDDEEEEPRFMTVDKLVCTFGTTQSYTIALTTT